MAVELLAVEGVPGCLGTIAGHEGHKAAVAATAALLLAAGPHDLHAGNGPKLPKLPLEHLLVHLRRKVADVKVGGEGVAIVKTPVAVAREGVEVGRPALGYCLCTALRLLLHFLEHEVNAFGL